MSRFLGGLAACVIAIGACRRQGVGKDATQAAEDLAMNLRTGSRAGCATVSPLAVPSGHTVVVAPRPKACLSCERVGYSLRALARDAARRQAGIRRPFV